MIHSVLVAFSEHLIEFMTFVLVCALFFRYAAYRANRRDEVFFSTFSREMNKNIEQDGIDRVSVKNVDDYLESLLEKVGKSLPSRGLRINKGNSSEPQEGQRRKVSVSEYVGGDLSIVNSLKGESNTFKSPQAPNFQELTARVMNKDKNWTKLFNIFPSDSVSRLIDVLPGIFVVMGIFGTFVGISNALPRIAEINFSNIGESSEFLGVFVKDVTFAMKTSIAGIAFSLIISFLNTLFPIRLMRKATAEKVQNSLENVWYFIQGKTKGESRQEELLADVKDLLLEMNERMSDRVRVKEKNHLSEAA